MQHSTSSKPSNLNDLLTDLEKHFPTSYQPNEDLHLGFDTNTTGRGHQPLALLRVSQRAEIPLILHWCQQHSVSLYPISTGFNWGYGSRTAFADNSIILDLSRLNRITHFDGELGLVSIEPGVTQAQLFAFLQDQKKHYMVPTTGAGPDCSILGNALERGFGLTPYTDHFFALQNCQVILPDGTSLADPFTEMGVPAVGRCFRWGIGADLKGLFSQSALGIVVEGTFALAPQPEAPLLLTLQIKNEDAFNEALDRVRETLFQVGGLIGGINLMNNLRVLTMQSICPEYFNINSLCLPQEEIQRLAQASGISAWMGIGNIFVPSGLESSVRRELKKVLARKGIDCRIFSRQQLLLAKRILRGFPFTPFTHLAQKVGRALDAYDILNGIPSRGALELTRWRTVSSAAQTPHLLNTALDNSPLQLDKSNIGLIWYAPLIEFKPAIIQEALTTFQTICNQHQLDCPITLTCCSPRFVETTIPLLFNRNHREETDRAQRCYDDLFEAGRKLGAVPYRVGSVGMDLLLKQQTPHWSTLRTIKRALDPKGILSNGHYSSN